MGSAPVHSSVKVGDGKKKPRSTSMDFFFGRQFQTGFLLRRTKKSQESSRKAGEAKKAAKSHKNPGPSVFDLSVSGRSLAGSEGPGPPKQKTKTGVFFGRYGASTEP